MTLLVVYVTLAIAVSFLCSVLEAVLLSITPAYVGALSREDPDAGARLQALKDDVDRPLAAILTLNTVAHTIGAAGAGAQAAAVFGSAWVGLFSAVLTLAVLIFSEIIPKSLGAAYWRPLAPAAGRVLQAMIVLLGPLVWLCRFVTRLVTPEREDASMSRDELAAMAEIGAEQGVVEGQEAEILKSLLRFNDLLAEDVMTPRTVLVDFPETATVNDVIEARVPFSRLPVWEKDRDHVTGFVLKDDVLERGAAGALDTPLRELQRDILAVDRRLPLPRLFDRLLARREHLALVIDGYGGTAGVVTMEDVIETLLGLEIVDEADEDTDMQQLARRRWQERAARLGLVPEPSEGGTEVTAAEAGEQASHAAGGPKHDEQG
ncbi:MAG: hemolysin family protein [Myxococcota bacterium]|nr:hemolysin family protein [Myxococcota bacterium]